jgi:hypothetical protein
MLNHNLHLDAGIAVETPQHTEPSPQAARLEDRLSPGQVLAPLSHAIASRHCRLLQGGSQVIIRFKNGYGAIISQYRLLEGIYEIAPLRFHGPGPDDYAFHFRSHVPDLTWSAEPDEIVGVCEQISRLLPPGQV